MQIFARCHGHLLEGKRSLPPLRQTGQLSRLPYPKTEADSVLSTTARTQMYGLIPRAKAAVIASDGGEPGRP